MLSNATAVFAILSIVCQAWFTFFQYAKKGRRVGKYGILAL